MVANRGEEPRFLGQHWSRYEALLHNRDVLDDRNKRAFLMVPREEFVPQAKPRRTYDHAFLDIGYGVTISGPHVVSRMTHVDRREARRQGARGRQPARLSVGLSRQPYRQGLDRRDHQALGRAHPQHLRRPDHARLQPNTRRSPARTRTATTAGRKRGRSTRSSYLRHRPHSPPSCSS